MTTAAIADLHCDLLCYLQGDKRRSVYDRAVGCSLPQLQEGNVKLQTLAVFVETAPGSDKRGHEQLEIFQQLSNNSTYPFFSISDKAQLDQLEKQEGIGLLLAIENASALCSEEAPLQEAFDAIEWIEKEVAKLTYLSLTWCDENRFGGGDKSSVGLKEEGKELLRFLDGRGCAIDLSHTSDALADDLFNLIEGEGLQLPVVASHSNCRAVREVARNLPDRLIKELFRRKGVMGLNFVRFFLGDDSNEAFAQHLEHLLALGGEDHVCFGADFFYGEDLPLSHPRRSEAFFFAPFSDASTYPKMVALCENRLGLGAQLQKKLCSQNLLRFLKEIWY